MITTRDALGDISLHNSDRITSTTAKLSSGKVKQRSERFLHQSELLSVVRIGAFQEPLDTAVNLEMAVYTNFWQDKGQLHEYPF
jgi:hypothetical protein